MKFEETYITVKGWMSSVLGLKGNKLMAFALVYGFSQDGQSESKASLSFICKWLNCSRPTAISVMKSLYKDGLILKRQTIENGDKRNYYRANLPFVGEQLKNFTSKETLPLSSKETLPVTSKETLPSNINSNIDSNNEGKSEDLPPDDLFKNIEGLKRKIGPKHYTLLNKTCKEEETYLLLRGMYNDGRFSSLMDWLEHKKELRSGYKKPSSIKSLIRKFSEYTPLEVKSALDYSTVENEYKGIFLKKLSDKQVSSQRKSQAKGKVRELYSSARKKVDVI